MVGGGWRGGLLLLLGFEAAVVFAILSWFCVHGQQLGSEPEDQSKLNPSAPSAPPPPPPPAPAPPPVPALPPPPSPPSTQSANSGLKQRGKVAGISLLAVAASLQLIFASLILLKRRHMLRTLQHYERQPSHTDTNAQ